VYFEGSPLAEEPESSMPREFPQFCMFSRSHENISFLLNTKQERSEEIKRELLCKERLPYSCGLLRFGNTLRWPLPKENTLE
jgi:hypothetical protein